MRLILVALLFFVAPQFARATPASQDCAACVVNQQVAPQAPDWPANVYEFLAQQIRTSLGFIPTSDASVPAPVKSAARSVFQVIALSVSEDGSDRILDFTASPQREKLAALKDKAARGEAAPQERVALLLVEKCERAGALAQCAFPELTRGSAFVAGAGNQLWTNFHVLEPNLERLRIEKKLSPEQVMAKAQPLGIFLFDHEGKLVFDGLKDKLTLGVLANEGRDVAGDFARVDLPRAIATPLAIATSAPDDTATYLVGYPSCTGCDAGGTPNDPHAADDRGKGRNSAGVGQYVTLGRVLPLNQGAGFLGPDIFTESQKDGFQAVTTLHFLATDAVPGNSGGPVLDQNGRVLMMVSGVKAKEIKGKVERVAMGLRPTQLFGQ